MIKIIEHGYKQFNARCWRCNCQFTYELDDVVEGKIKCPDCEYENGHYCEDYVIKSQVKDNE